MQIDWMEKRFLGTSHLLPDAGRLYSAHPTHPHPDEIQTDTTNNMNYPKKKKNKTMCKCALHSCKPEQIDLLLCAFDYIELQYSNTNFDQR